MKFNRKKKYPRVYIGPVEIAGYYANLAEGLRAMGVICDFITYDPHPFGYGGESPTPFLIRMGRLWDSRSNEKNRTLRPYFAFISLVCFYLWALLAIFRYDVFIFGFGESLLRGNRDLVFLRLMRKKVIVNLGHGSEARPPYIDGSLQSNDGVYPCIKEIFELTIKRKARVSHIESWATTVIGAPLTTSHFSRVKFINIFALGIPIQMNQFVAVHSNTHLKKEGVTSLPIRILHSPSRFAAKGTEVIKVAIENLITRGYDIDFVLVHGRPVEEVITAIQNCDFVVDQVYSDTPLAGFASEAAWFGKPAVVGGYGWDMIRNCVPEGMWPPSRICHPDDLESAIESLICDREERLELGRQAQVFVREMWNAEAVAARFLKLVQEDIPDEWWFDPNDVFFLKGGYQTINRTKENVRQMVSRFGIQSLELSHRPELEKAFLEFASLNKVQS